MLHTKVHSTFPTAGLMTSGRRPSANGGRDRGADPHGAQDTTDRT